MKAIFHCLEEKRSVHPDLGPPRRSFAMTLLVESGQWPQPQSQNRWTKLKDNFHPSEKPNQRAVEWTRSLFENVQSKSSKNENTKKSAKVNCLFLIWETVNQ